MSKIHVNLSVSQRKRIEAFMRKTSNKFEALRCRIVLLLNERCSVNTVASLAGCVRATVYRTVYRFEDFGEDGLLDGRKNRTPLNRHYPYGPTCAHRGQVFVIVRNRT